MIHVRRHIPDYVDHDGPIETAIVPDTLTLLSVDWIAGWQDEPGFAGFALSAHCIMVLCRSRWHVIALLVPGSDRPDLAEWVP